MGPKKAGQPVKAGLRRTAFLDRVRSEADLSHGHALQFAGLAPASGFTLGSTATPSGVSSTPPPTAGPSYSRPADKGKGKSTSPIEILDSEGEGGGSGAGGASDDDDDDGQAASAKPHVCSRTNCAGNPNCLRYLNQEKWTADTDKARELFLKEALVGGNPLSLARDQGAPCGLRLGATCYANALLQTWHHNTDFRQIIYSLEPSATDRAGLESTPLYQLQTVFHGLEASNQSHFDPKGLVETLQLEQGEQQDAQEFSKLFLDLIGKAVPALPDATGQNVVEAQFGGGLEYVTRCRTCKYESRRESTFTELDLTIQPGKDVDYLLRGLLEHEIMDGANQYDCPRCAKHRDALRYTEITSLPPTLNLSLLRFVYDAEAGERVKTTRIVRFPPSIDMRPYITGGDEQDELVYDLRAVLVHKGESANSGHYCAQVYNSLDDFWYECDDEAVLEIKPLTPPSVQGRKPSKSQLPVKASQDLPRPPAAGSQYSPVKAFQKLFDYTKRSDGQSATSPDDNPAQPMSTEATLDRLLPTSSSSPLKKSFKSDVPPWAAFGAKPDEPISLDVTTDEEDDGCLEVKPRPHNWKPSWSHTVPEQVQPARPPPQSERDRFSSSATISHAQAGSSQRTYGKGSAKGWLPERPDLQASKDAYMLVYQRRQPPSAMEVESIQAPAYVRKEIERRNLSWSTACRLWELKQEIAVETFVEVLEAKKAVFDKWEVDSFDEPAYVLEATDLTAWVDQGLWEKPPKKGDDKKVPSPSGEPGKDCKGCSEPSTIVIDNKEPNAPLVGSTSPTDDGDLLSLEPEQVTPELLADVPTVKAAREAFKKRLRDGALARSLGAGTICTHGKIRSLLPEVLSIKRVSAMAVDRLVRLGCTLEPGVERISPATLCLECTREYYRARTTRREREESTATFKELDSEDGGGFWVSKAWYRDFVGTQSKGPTPIADPTDEKYRTHVFCEHGELATVQSARRLISPKAFHFLRTIFDCLVAPGFEADECETCLLGMRPDLEKAEEERRDLNKLYKRCLDHVANKEKSLVLGALAMVDTEFLLKWFRWSHRPASESRPTSIATQQFICEHKKLRYDLADPRDFADDSFAFIQIREWETLAAVYDHGPEIRVEYDDFDLGNPWDVEPKTCEPCRRARLRDLHEGPIDVIVVKSSEEIASAAENRSVSKALARTTADRSGGRKSKRKRGGQKEELIAVVIEPGDTVKDVKVALAESLDTSVLYLTLYRSFLRGHKELDDASKSLRELDIVVGDCLFVFFQGEDIDEDEQEQLAIAGVSTKMPRRSAADRGAGFGGTLLSGGHGPAPPAASSNSKPTSGSTSSTLKSASPESGVAVDGHRAATGRSMAAIEADIEAGVNVTAAEMEAFFQSTTGDDPVEAGSNACGQCTFVNEPDATACAMCETAL